MRTPNAKNTFVYIRKPFENCFLNVDDHYIYAVVAIIIITVAIIIIHSG